MKPQKVPFADSIYSNSPLEDVEVFIHKLIPEFNQVLFDARIKEVLPSVEVILSNKPYRSFATDEQIWIRIGSDRKSLGFKEYKRYAKDKIIGSLAYVHFQDIVMALVAHEYAHFVQDNIYEDTKPHGKEFQHIYSILRQYTNSFLPDYAIIGYSDLYTLLYKSQDKFKANEQKYFEQNTDIKLST